MTKAKGVPHGNDNSKNDNKCYARNSKTIPITQIREEIL
jgi:hypothetical protein